MPTYEEIAEEAFGQMQDQYGIGLPRIPAAIQGRIQRKAQQDSPGRRTIHVPATAPAPRPSSSAALANILEAFTLTPPQVQGPTVSASLPTRSWPHAVQRAAAFAKQRALILDVTFADTDMTSEVVHLGFELRPYQR